jgi:MFS family permease
MGAIVNTAEAVTKALTVGPILGPILAGIIAALGAVQVALIAKQPIPLAEGATFDKPTLLQNVLVGEKRPEFLLDAPRLQEIVRSAFTAPAFSGAPAMAMAGAGGGGVVNMNFHAPLITTTGISRRDVDEASGLIFEAMDRETRRRGYRISGR